MQAIYEHNYSCPYCGETNTLLLDTSGEESLLIEDCYVCCRPIHIHLRSAATPHDEPEIIIASENDA